MSPSAFSILGPPRPRGAGGVGQICTKTFLGQVGICVQNFIMIGAGFGFQTSPPHTNRQTNKQTNIYLPIFIYIEDRRLSLLKFLNLL